MYGPEVALRGALGILPGDDVGARTNRRRCFELPASAGYDEVAALAEGWWPYGRLGCPRGHPYDETHEGHAHRVGHHALVVRRPRPFPVGEVAAQLGLALADEVADLQCKFVDFFGSRMANVRLANRATIGNIGPECDSMCAIFPIDDATLDYPCLTGRSVHQVRLVDAYAKEQGLWRDPAHKPECPEVIELDPASVQPSIAGPMRCQDLIALRTSPHAVAALSVDQTVVVTAPALLEEASAESFPASDPVEEPAEAAYYRHGGIMPYVLRQLVADSWRAANER